MKPIEYVIQRKKIQKHIDDLYEFLVKMALQVDETFPERVRSATPEDVWVGNILWYKNFDEGEGFKIVEDVHNPYDLFKAYTAEDGCRYGIDGAFLEVN